MAALRWTTEGASAEESVFAAVHKAALLKMVGTGTDVFLLDRPQVVVEVGILPHSGDRLL